jgi:alpha-N-arabinofuranosidase
MDGSWQIGMKTPTEYGRLAAETAKIMNWVDPSIELVACGSSNSEMPEFGRWEREMLEQCYENIDYVSLHRYYANAAKDTPAFLALSMDMDHFIKTVASICDAVGGQKRSKKKVQLSFDEWNVWYHSRQQDEEIWKREKWGRSLPLLEDVYNFEDALLVGSILITLLRNADRVKIACIAQTVNVIAPIMVDKGGRAWRQTTYYPLYYASRHGRGTALRQAIESPTLPLAHPDRGGPAAIPALSSAVTARGGEVAVFAVNRHEKEEMRLTAVLERMGGPALVEHLEIAHPDLGAVNSADAQPVSPRRADRVRIEGDAITAVLAPASWNLIRLSF